MHPSSPLTYADQVADTINQRTIAGREIQFRPPTDAQLLVVGRLMRTGRQFVESEPENMDKVQIQGGVERMSIILDVIDSMIISPADRAYLEEQLVSGQLDLEELMAAFDTEQEPTNRATKRAVARKSTRARTR